MNRMIQLKETTPLFLVALLLCFGVLQGVQAVVPPPDGGYPNFNTAEGQNALKNLTNGAANTGLGWYSLFSDTTGSFNTATGAGSLLFNTGNNNTAAGAAALLFNSGGSDSTAVGAAALLNNTATGNTAIGSNALLNNTTGGTLGNIQGVDVGPNVAVGWQALESNTVGSANTAVGYQALYSFTAGPMGFEQVGLCTAVGFRALANATADGFANSAFGYQALYNNSDGFGNTAIGTQALLSNAIGSSNVAIGNNALSNNTAGNGNAALGFNAGATVTTASNVICIGTLGQNVDNSCFIGSIFGQVSASGAAVYVNSNHKLGTLTSSSRFKDDIKPMERLSEALFALKPVTFHYKKVIDPAGMQQFGLVAEEVEKVNPDLVVRDKEGKPYSVRYDQVNAMLLNEFLKEHRKNEQQEATIAHQQKQIEALAAGLQRVSAQLEVTRPAPQTALSNNNR
jgi:hypothetical protein